MYKGYLDIADYLLGLLIVFLPLDIPEHADPTRSSEITGEDRVIYNNDFLTIRRMLTPNL